MSHKILIVEDHPAVRSMLVSLFKNHQYEPDEAADGAIGLEKARQGGYTAILLDLKLPQLDGFEVLRQLKIIPPTVPNGPIIVFSSHDYDHAIKEAYNLGASGFIVKDNLDTINLVAKVEAIINNPNFTKPT